MVGLGSSGQSIKKINSRRAIGEIPETASPVRRQEQTEIFIIENYFLKPVIVPVLDLHFQPVVTGMHFPDNNIFCFNNVFVNGCPEKVEVQAAKYAVPVGAVALGGPEEIPGSITGSFAGNLLQPFSYRQHFFMHAVTFGIANQEIAPETASPLFHLPVRSGRQINSPLGRVFIHVIAKCPRFNPLRVFCQ